MASNPPVGHQSSLAGTATTKLPTTLPENAKDLDPEILAAIIASREEEEKKRQLAGWVEREFFKCKNARIPFEQQWFLNLAFCAGKQYVAPLTVAGGLGFRLITPKTPFHRVRLVVNKVRPAVRTECSKLTTSKPIPTVMPATNEDEDFSAAAVGEQILKSKFATADFESTYRSWIWWGVVCGTSFLKQYWSDYDLDYDAKALPPKPMFPGTTTPIPDEILDKMFEADPDLEKQLQTPRPAKGKICIERITPFHIYVPDLLCEDMNHQPYVIHVMTKTPQWVKQTYGIQATPDSRASSTVLDAATIISKGSDDQNDAVLVKEVWVKPGTHDLLPKGGVLTVINSKVIQMRDWPYPFPEYPFYKYNGIPTGGFYSDSTIVDMIPLQKEYNKKRSQAIEIQNTMGKPRLLYPKGSIDPKRLSSEPGQSVGYTNGYEKPEVMPAAEVPASFVNEIEKLQQEFDDVSGQHEISRGQTSLSSLTSGTAIAYLQEQDDAKLNFQVASIENACEQLGSHYLILASHKWDDNRLIKTTGRNNTFEALHWKKGMLKGNTDVKIQTGSALPYSKAAKQAIVTEMMQNGFLDPQTGLEMMNFGGIDKAVEDSLIDKRQCTRENIKMAEIPESMLQLLLQPSPGPGGEPPYDDPNTGQQFNGDGTPFQPQPPVPVNSWDDHEQHIHWHNHFRKGQEFELLPELNKKAFELHVQLHQIALQSQLMGFGGNVLNGGQQQQGGFEEEQSYQDSGGGGAETQPPGNESR